MIAPVGLTIGAGAIDDDVLGEGTALGCGATDDATGGPPYTATGGRGDGSLGEGDAEADEVDVALIGVETLPRAVSGYTSRSVGRSQPATCAMEAARIAAVNIGRRRVEGAAQNGQIVASS